MYRKILLAIDSEDDGEGKRALEEGVRLLGEGSELHLATVFDPGGAGFFPHITADAPEDRESEVRESLSLLARKYLPMPHSASLHVVAGTPGEKLVALAANIGADLIILVSKGAGSRWPMRRATVECVAVNACCAVLVLPALAKAPDETEDSL
ncbi:Nucleotide-binding universal stress protein, UspA family [Marinobacter sp. LV10R510-11A]|uniref:universal stress protein n=1 Tax=Marinobacter sp. LV10R510-11A TaxID=1415568 RepID=UPI000BB6E815|nr:universal stress protein [Marinobacter sp. LV10R510-11A]SOB78003.1 Nucleotide-binding universal stress protein, UspA family [Marinobacter sp. LV10R510-11A]